ncbi:hypothetical protein [Rodentibacter caecimuris]|uniref:hypothetical protein n=1 Tax=Rodentibacter caecimuris TaxID=1796644 RepID=UPI0013A080C8|nr:hypothetical protein [Rodentibacter heylii]QIA76060.1 hypothetical protein FEE42_01140 [Rodentibacter heylii]
MQHKIEQFTQHQAEFSAGLHQLETLDKEIDRQNKIILALDNEISELEEQGKATNGQALPDSDLFMKFYSKEREARDKRAGVRQFVKQLQHNRECLTLDLSETKRRLIHAHSDLVESAGEKIIDEITSQICQPLANALQAISLSEGFKADLRNRENILRKNIDPLDFILTLFMQKLEQKGVKLLNQKDRTILAYKLDFEQLDKIPDISPIKANQLRQALRQGE